MTFPWDDMKLYQKVNRNGCTCWGPFHATKICLKIIPMPMYKKFHHKPTLNNLFIYLCTKTIHIPMNIKIIHTSMYKKNLFIYLGTKNYSRTYVKKISIFLPTKIFIFLCTKIIHMPMFEKNIHIPICKIFLCAYAQENYFYSYIQWLFIYLHTKIIHMPTYKNIHMPTYKIIHMPMYKNYSYANVQKLFICLCTILSR